jgi:hypothetical protein
MLDIAEPFTTRAAPDVAAWAARFDPAALPVLAATAAEIEELRPLEDEVDASTLAEVIAGDPLMTLKLLAHVAHVARLARARRGRDASGAETVTAALLMLGVPPFFRAFGPQPTVQQRLGRLPRSMAGFERVLVFLDSNHTRDHVYQELLAYSLRYTHRGRRTIGKP